MKPDEIKEHENPVEKIDETFIKFTEKIRQFGKNIPPEEIQQFKQEISQLSKQIPEQKKSEIVDFTQHIEGSIDIPTTTYQIEYSKNWLPSKGFFFNLPDTIKVKLELIGEDLEAISKFSIRFNPNDHLVSRYSLNNDIVKLSVLQDFIIRNYTNLNPEVLTFQDKLHINYQIGLNNFISPNLTITCPKNHTFDVLLSEFFKTSEISYTILDEQQIAKIAAEFGFEIVNENFGKVFQYNNLPSKPKFKILPSIFYPVLFAPKSIFDLLILTYHNPQQTPDENYKFLKSLPMKHIQNIYTFILGISLGILKEPIYGYNLTKEIKFVCPQDNETITMTMFEVIANFFIVA